jgi:hypothetical protein
MKAALVGMVLLTTGGCVGGWTQMKTAHITGYAETPHSYRNSMKQMEYAYAALSSFFPRAEVGNVDVLFLDGPTMVADYGTGRGGMVLPTLPGATTIGSKNLVVVGEAGLFSSARLLAHLFIDKALPAAPLWLHEGLAEYFTSVQMQSGDGRWRACFGSTGPMAVNYIQIPLEKLFTITWQQYPTSEPAWYDATGWLLMDYVFHGEKGANFKKLPLIFDAVGEGAPAAKIMAATFPGMTLEQLGKRIADFKASSTEQRERNLMCALPVPIAPEKFPDEADPRETPADAQQIAQVRAALAKLPHGERFASWYPREVLAGH